MAGNGNPPAATAAIPDFALMAGGGFFFATIILIAIRIVYPNFFKRWFRAVDTILDAMGSAILIPDFGAPTLAKQVVELKNELEKIRSSVVEDNVELGPQRSGFETSPETMIDATITTRLRRDAESMTLPELLQIKREFSYASQQREAQSDLEIAMDQELGSARTIKKIMLNFFIVFNFLLIISLAYLNSIIQKDLSVSAYQGITALYVSLAVFVVYVYRSANSRILIILANKEDTKRLFNAERYLSGRAKSATSERDVEVLKLLLINRMEREKGSEHPYELVLKGITNSNVLVKGGKVTETTPKKNNE